MKRSNKSKRFREKISIPSAPVKKCLSASYYVRGHSEDTWRVIRWAMPGDPEIVASRFERTLADMSKEIRPSDAFGSVIFRTLGRTRPVNSRITWELLRLFATSERTLWRRCEELFGYGPKTSDRILRMQRFLGLARAYGRLGLANLAGAVGYADQAHLSREARRLTGLTPRAILAQLAYSSDQSPIDFGNDKKGQEILLGQT